jgi:hypothetical protein
VTARAIADAIVALHALFVIFAFLGGALVLRWPRIAIAHLPAVAWAAWVELSGTICPLTPLENEWRRAAGTAGYEGGFIEHYVVPVLYPAELTPRVQIALGLALIAVNVSFYASAWWRASRRTRSSQGRPHPQVR